jgi:hypothetical protein
MRLMLVFGVVFATLGMSVEYWGVSTDVLLIGPLLCVAIPLLGGRYIGEEQLAKLAAAVASRRRPRRAIAAAPKPRRAPVLVVRGGRLLGTTHAIRPPPAPLVA